MWKTIRTFHSIQATTSLGSLNIIVIVVSMLRRKIPPPSSRNFSTDSCGFFSCFWRMLSTGAGGQKAFPDGSKKVGVEKDDWVCGMFYVVWLAFRSRYSTEHWLFCSIRIDLLRKHRWCPHHPWAHIESRSSSCWRFWCSPFIGRKHLFHSFILFFSSIIQFHIWTWYRVRTREKNEENGVEKNVENPLRDEAEPRIICKGTDLSWG